MTLCVRESLFSFSASDLSGLLGVNYKNGENEEGKRKVS